MLASGKGEYLGTTNNPEADILQADLTHMHQDQLRMSILSSIHCEAEEIKGAATKSLAIGKAAALHSVTSEHLKFGGKQLQA